METRDLQQEFEHLIEQLTNLKSYADSIREQTELTKKTGEFSNELVAKIQLVINSIGDDQATKKEEIQSLISRLRDCIDSFENKSDEAQNRLGTFIGEFQQTISSAKIEFESSLNKLENKVSQLVTDSTSTIREELENAVHQFKRVSDDISSSYKDFLTNQESELNAFRTQLEAELLKGFNGFQKRQEHQLHVLNSLETSLGVTLTEHYKAMNEELNVQRNKAKIQNEELSLSVAKNRTLIIIAMIASIINLGLLALVFAKQ